MPSPTHTVGGPQQLGSLGTQKLSWSVKLELNILCSLMVIKGTRLCSLVSSLTNPLWFLCLQRTQSTVGNVRTEPSAGRPQHQESMGKRKGLRESRAVAGSVVDCHSAARSVTRLGELGAL